MKTRLLKKLVFHNVRSSLAHQQELIVQDSIRTSIPHPQLQRNENPRLGRVTNKRTNKYHTQLNLYYMSTMFIRTQR